MILNKITPDGQVQIVGTGFTTILGLAFDNRDRMYVLEDTYVPNATSPIFQKKGPASLPVSALSWSERP